MNTDIRIEITFKGHRKRRRLNELLQCEATGYLLDLWITIAQERPSGKLTNWDDKDIALAAGWQGDSSQFVNALLQAKLLDVNGDKIFCPHDWEDHQPWICGTTDRKEAARKAGTASAIARANKRLKFNEQPTESNEPLEVVEKPLVNNELTNGKPTDGQPRTSTVPVPYQYLINLFHRLCVSLPQVRSLTDKRKTLIKRIYLKDSTEGFEELFNKVEASDFLTGRKSNWKASFDWILKEENRVRILEGIFDNGTTNKERPTKVYTRPEELD